MDAHDIFKKLTRGVRFKSKNQLKIKERSCKSKLTKNERKEDFNLKTENERSGAEKADESFLFLNDDRQSDNKGDTKKKKKSKSKSKLKMLENEEVNHFRRINRIHVVGSKIPPPMRTFEELETKHRVQSEVLESIADCAYSTPTPIQMQSIPIMMEGRALTACAPTGSGKTIAFLVPIIRDLKEPQKKGFRALILCPTRELAKQTLRECLRLTENIGLKIHILSKVNQAEQKYGPKSSKKYDILISTPNRVCYLLREDPPLLDLKNVEWLIIDEADKLMEDGVKGFKEQFDEIFNACSNESKKVALFSATHTSNVAKWASNNLKKLVRVIIGERNAATDLVEQSLLFVGSESGKLLAIRNLIKKGLEPPVLIFVQSKDRAKQLFGELIYDGINVDVIHADRTQQQRDNVVKAFREGKIWVLICTDLMGRGIDFKGINLVINYDFPPDSISYVHRIGRAGRAGRPGKAITYFTQDDTPNLRSIAHIIKNSGGNVPDFMLSLKKIRKSEKKKMKRAPEREDITTIPKFELERRARLKKLKEIKKRKNGAIEKNTEVSTTPPSKSNKTANKGRKKMKFSKVTENVER